MFKDIENRFGAKIQDIKVLKSGWAGEIISLEFKDNTQKYVIKTYNSSKNGLENIKQEWTGLNLLYNANYPVPRPIISDFVNEKPYIVMEKIEGENLWTCYQTLSKEDRQQLLEKFVKVFLKLHELDVSIIDKELRKDSTSSFIEKEINEIKKLVEENKLEYFTQIIDWLQKEKANIIGEKLSIIHRDYHPWNVIVDNNKAIYVIDLLWGIGDYRFDLAWMYTLMERSGFEDFSQNALKKYKELKNQNINNFEYFKVFSTLRWLINVMISLKTGENLNETRNKEFENFVSPLIQNRIMSIKKITGIQITI
ncbi:aminoglycoside phosphotransferase family protein [Clostridium botulinum]|uniref:Phosphotransferase enzyme family n=1 Tax=Clostridium botulinum (strain Eklund 17B / Type B) TaxID=935198 RepID=B2TNJ0_CLOBB|nr:putative phosphotransferase enzyme family [Clostridium botulinum B str. Eklund 17B (NRP)]MBY6976121.1 aminoglycoside phosphotransferase family protein [Clostridium botulinum]MBY7000544.1 aminoglycoside phosphotransferase family protein [Clostridium botulinum]MCR1273305.1 aminoglycoside phosphotransferase family protein [Clostridium botulinum]NFD70404.1 aminoglycoside phosphotransferase family protein [Clostridium botulinum]